MARAKVKKVSKAKKRHLVRNSILLIIGLIVLFIAWCFANQSEGNEQVIEQMERIPSLEIPSMGKNEGEIIRHTGYTLSYNEEHEQPNWVAYELTRNEVVITR